MELGEKLARANYIITEAFKHLETAEGIRNEAARKEKSRKTWDVLISIGIAYGASIILPGCIALLLPRNNTVLLGVLSLVFSIGAVFIGIAVYKKKFSPATKEYADNMRKRALAEQTHGECLLEKNANDIVFIPSGYRYPLATNYLMNIVQTGRATTLNEALAMFDLQLHRWKVEDANAAILEQQMMQTRALSGIRKSSAVNATANVVNMAANVSRWF